MTIRHFQILAAIHDRGSITAAADELNITQPSVSIAVKELEAFYHTQLFDRSHRKVVLTKEGEVLLEYARRILAQWEEAAFLLRSGGLPSLCRLGIVPGMERTHTSRFYKVLRNSLPDHCLHATIESADTLQRMLSENKLDIAVLEGENGLPLFTEEAVCVCTAGLWDAPSITSEVLAAQPLLLWDKRNGLRPWVEKLFAEKNLQPHIAGESCDGLSLLHLAEAGAGFVFLGKETAEGACQSMALHTVEITDLPTERTFSLYCGKQGRKLADTVWKAWSEKNAAF